MIKVVRYGLNIQCYPDTHAVELVEKQIASAGSSGLLCKRRDLFTPKIVAHSLDDLLSRE